MMRLVTTCFSLPMVFAPFIVAGQQAQPATSQKPEQTNAVKQTSSPNSSEIAIGHGAPHHSSKAATRKDAPLCQAPEVAVDVIMGTQVRHTCFDPRPSAEENKSSADQLAVEVINGSTENTQFFYGNGQDEQIEAMLNKPVVVGVESSDTRTMGGNVNPLVTRVNSAGTDDAITSGSGLPVTKRISPRPKRPAYQPNVQ